MPVGAEDFKDLVTRDCHFVDKTKFIGLARQGGGKEIWCYGIAFWGKRVWREGA